MNSQNEKERGGSRAGTLLLAEINQYRLRGDYKSLLTASHTLPSSTILQSASLRNLILGECELEEYVIHQQQRQEIYDGEEDTEDCDDNSLSGSSPSLQVAKRYLKEVISANTNQSDSLEASLYLARVYLMSGRSSDAIKIYKENIPLLEADLSMSQFRAILTAHAFLCYGTLVEEPREIHDACFQPLLLTTALSDISHFLLSYLRHLACTSLQDAIDETRNLISQRNAVPPELRVELLVLLSDIYLDNPAVSTCYQRLSTTKMLSSSSAKRNSRTASDMQSSKPETPDEEAILALLIAELELLSTQVAFEHVKIYLQVYESIVMFLLLNEQYLHAHAVIERAVATTYGVENFHLWMLLASVAESTNQLGYSLAIFQQCGKDITSTNEQGKKCLSYVAAARVGLLVASSSRQSTASNFVSVFEEMVLNLLDQARPLAPEISYLTIIDQLYAICHLQRFRNSLDPSRQAHSLRSAKACLARINTDVKTADCYYLEALVAVHAGATDDAASAIWDCLALANSHRAGMLLLALIMTAKHEYVYMNTFWSYISAFSYEGAISVCKSVLSLFPSDMLAMRITALCAHVLNGPRIALGTYETFFSIIRPTVRSPNKSSRSVMSGYTIPGAPEDSTNLDLLGVDEAESTFSIQSGRLSSTSNSGSEIEDWFSAGGAGIASEILMSEIWLDCAKWFNSLGQLEDAEKCIQQVRQISGTFAASECFMARCSHQQGRFREAIRQYEQALTFDNQNVTALINLGICQHVQGETDMAEHHIHRALRAEPTNAEAHRALAHLLRERGELEQSAQCLLRALQLEAHQPLVSYDKLPCLPFFAA
eukprot:gene10999-3071_t